MHYIPGQGTKKPLNMIQSPVYADIRQAPIEFKSSKKYWTVDTGQTLLDTEANTQLVEDAVLSKSYRENIDKYGKSSHQEKITVFRPPLQTPYEDYGPLNRLPVKVHAIVPYINPGTADSAGGTNAYRVNNSTTQEVSRFMTDRVSSESWHQTFYMPVDTSLDNVILPDLVTTIPSYSSSAGYEVSKFNAPHAMDGHIIERVNLPKTAYSAGYKTPFTVNGETNLDNVTLVNNIPAHSVSAGMDNFVKIDGEAGLKDITLIRNTPEMSMSAGYLSPHTVDGENNLSFIELPQQLTTKLNISNPGSEDGYQTHIASHIPYNDHIKMKENPRVPVAAHSSFGYQSENRYVKPHFRGKLQPDKSYGNGLGGGTIKTFGIDEPKIGSKYLRNPKVQQAY